MKRLHLVVRGDLNPGQQAVQAAHALQEFNQKFPEETQTWYRESNTLVFLEVENEAALGVILEKACERGYTSVPFTEPDLNDSLTAIALGPEASSLTRNLKLALRWHSSSSSLSPVSSGVRASTS